MHTASEHRLVNLSHLLNSQHVHRRHCSRAEPTRNSSMPAHNAPQSSTCRQFALVCSNAPADANPTVTAFFDNLVDTIAEATSFLSDPQNSSTPIEIVNLDTGDVWIPQYNRLAWEIDATHNLTQLAAHETRQISH